MGFFDKLGGAVVSAGSSLLGNALGAATQSSVNKTNLKIAQMNNDFNAAEAQKSRDFQLDMWNRENGYNTASAQRQRLEEAGLNPYLMMSGGSAGTASSAGGSAAASASGNPQMQAFRPDFSSIPAGIASFAQAEKLNKESQYQGIVNHFGYDFMRAQIEKMQGDTDWANASPTMKTYLQQNSGRIAQLQLSSLEQQQRNLQYTGNLIQAQAAHSYMSAQAQEILNKYLDEQQQMDLNVKAANYTKLVLEGQLSVQQAKESISREVLNYARTAGQKISNRIASETADNIIFAHNMYNKAEGMYQEARQRNVKGEQEIDWKTKRAFGAGLEKENERKDKINDAFWFDRTIGKGIDIIGNIIGDTFRAFSSRPYDVFETDYTRDGTAGRTRHRHYTR